MRVLYVCSAGARRSAALAAYSNHFKAKAGIKDCEFAHAAIDESKRTRDLEKRVKRLATLRKAGFGRYRGLVDRLSLGNNDVHPRMGVLLLADGIYEVADQKMMIFTPELRRDFDLVLAVESILKYQIIGLSTNGGSNDSTQSNGYTNGKVYTVKEFLGYPPSERDIRDIKNYYLPFAWYQMWEDRNMRDDLKRIAIKVVRKISEMKTSAR